MIQFHKAIIDYISNFRRGPARGFIVALGLVLAYLPGCRRLPDGQSSGWGIGGGPTSIVAVPELPVGDRRWPTWTVGARPARSAMADGDGGWRGHTGSAGLGLEGDLQPSCFPGLKIDA